MQLLIGNIVALIASILMVYTGFIKKKDKIIFVQAIQIGLFAVSNIILGGITGAIVNIISFVRNLLCYKDKLGKKEKLVIIASSTILSIVFNNLGFIGLLPVISTVTYTAFMDLKDVIKFKKLVIFTLVMWFIYDVYIKSYSSAIFDFLNICANVYAIYKLKTVKDKEVQI